MSRSEIMLIREAPQEQNKGVKSAFDLFPSAGK